MKASSFFYLVLVSAIWGASHSLVRIAVGEWGGALTAFLRMLIAAITLMFALRVLQRKLNVRENIREFLVIAVLNASLPIFLFAYAAQSLLASYLAILNATMPVFNAIFSSLILRDEWTWKKVFGILLGFAGIILLEEGGTIPRLDSVNFFAMLCALGAAASYAMAAVYLKKSPKKIDPTVLTAGSNALGAIFLFPFAFQGNWHWAGGAPLISILILGAFGSGLAFVLYYRLIQEIGAFRASMSVFIMPVFGLFWSWLFLNEHPNLAMLVGVGMIISATALFLKRPARE